MKRLLLAAVAVFSGCSVRVPDSSSSAPEPAAVLQPPDRTDDLLRQIQLLRQDYAMLASTQKMLQEQAEVVAALAEATKPSKKGWTGALVHIADGGWCDPCNRLKTDLRERTKGTKWRIGRSDSDHFKLVEHERAEGWTLPTVEYFKGGEHVNTLEGYGGDIDEVLRLHPAAAPKKIANGAETVERRIVVESTTRPVGYPLRGSWWSHPGLGRADLIRHLMTDGIHAGKFDPAWLNSLSLEELESLHSDDHEASPRVVRYRLVAPRPVGIGVGIGPGGFGMRVGTL